MRLFAACFEVWDRLTYAVGDDVRVAVQRALGVAVRGLVACQVPDDQSLVTGGGEEHVRAASIFVSILIFTTAGTCAVLFDVHILLERCGQAGDPS